MKRTVADRVFDTMNGLFLLLLVVATLYPFYYVIMASISDSSLLLQHEGLLLAPLGLNFDAFGMVLKNPNILSGYQNTLIILLAGTSVNIVLTSIGAYALSRKFLLRKGIMIGIIFTMFFSGGLIPTYLLINNTLHMGNNYLALIIPGAISTWNLIIMRTSFEAIPESLLESARIDGAGEFRIFSQVIIPLSMPIIAVMLLYYGVAHWNSWFNAMLFMHKREMFPLQLILREILVQNSTDSMMTGTVSIDREAIGESIKYATIVVATLPILLIYPFLQKYFVKGVMVGAIKE
ncbi:carbohydrate ABC transporter permease [Paenibacillus qinlingensis]|uniref:carbohydrate ABC transporter permease n=1 Tax=Paenibacillus qinlingensis TaxID=1837343 RepID=UPI001566BFE8|nr:carbohydrate ABC transporter permease [Paenibacillus qinlingensis]NQX63334.1 carbohydrate ABC transporter permease [Paenibacillus qinlingensis]